MINDMFNVLWHNTNNGVICKRKELQEFVLYNTNHFGKAMIAVRGTCREICWKSLGAGLYRVYTKE